MNLVDDTAGFCPKAGPKEVLVELPEQFPGFIGADVTTKPVPQDKADDCSHAFSGNSEHLRMRK